MLKKSFDPALAFTAGDETQLQELLHPKNDPVECKCSVAQASLEAGASSLPHQLIQTEIFYFLKGTGRVQVGDESTDVRAGDLVHIPPRSEQRIENTGEETLHFLCIVQPPWSEAGETVSSE